MMYFRNLFNSLLGQGVNAQASGAFDFGVGGGVEWLVRSGQDFRKSPTAHACASIISNTISSLPVRIMKGKGSNNSYPDLDHNLNNIFSGYANTYLSSINFTRFLVESIVLEDGGYAVIIRNSRTGVVDQLLPVHPSVVSRELKDGKIVYSVHVVKDGVANLLKVKAHNMLHIPSMNGWDSDNLTGYSVMDKFKESIGMEYQTREFAKNFFENGVNGNTVFELDDVTNIEKVKNIANHIKINYGGVGNSNKPIVTPAKVKRLESPLRNSGVKEARETNISEIAMIFGVPLPLISTSIDQESTGYNGGIEINRQFINYKLRPIVESLEQELDMKLFTAYEREQGYKFDFDFSNMLRGDNKSIAEYVRSLTGGTQFNAVITINEAREHLGLSNIEGGDILHTVDGLEPENKKEIEDAQE